MSDEFLYQFQKQPSSQFTNRLYKHINEMPAKKTRVVRRLSYIMACVVLVMGLIMAFLPAARVYAQEMIYTIGQWIMDHRPTAAEQFEETLAARDAQQYVAASNEVIEWQAPTWLTLEEAESKTGFLPVEISVDELVFVSLFRQVNTNDESVSVTTVYQSNETVLSFRQTKVLSTDAVSELTVGDARVTEVKVDDLKGYWVEGLRLSTYVNDENKVEPKIANVLVWETDDFEFWLQSSPGLPLEDMLKMIR
jgi:hypothetical protein